MNVDDDDEVLSVTEEIRFNAFFKIPPLVVVVFVCLLWTRRITAKRIEYKSMP